MKFIEALALELGVAGGVFRYGKLVDDNGDPLGQGGVDSRDDFRFELAFRAEYRVSHWLAFMLDAVYSGTVTDFVYETTQLDGTVNVDPADYSKFETFAGVRVSY
jgi:hypothetical protein